MLLALATIDISAALFCSDPPQATKSAEEVAKLTTTSALAGRIAVPLLGNFGTADYHVPGRRIELCFFRNETTDCEMPRLAV